MAQNTPIRSANADVNNVAHGMHNGLETIASVVKQKVFIGW